MSHEPPDLPHEDGDEPHTSDFETELPIERTPDGRFKPGQCPNRKGRPKKARPSNMDVLLGILNEKIPVKTPGCASMTMFEAQIRTLCNFGLKDPRTAMGIIKLALQSATPAEAEEGALDDIETSEQVLTRFLEREERRRKQRGKSVESSVTSEGKEA